MKTTYDKYYQTENLFGNPYPELIDFFKKQKLGKVLDLGCGQGRDAIALARLGFAVVGVDISKVGIEQMNTIAQKEQLSLTGEVADIFKYNGFEKYDYVLLDSMFHFSKNDKAQEIQLIQKIIITVKMNSCIVFCIQDSGKKVEILRQVIDEYTNLQYLTNTKFQYTFKDNKHTSTSDYRMIVIQKT